MLFKSWCSSLDISLCLSIAVYFTSVRRAKSGIWPRLGGLTTVLMFMISSTDGICKKVPVCVSGARFLIERTSEYKAYVSPRLKHVTLGLAMYYETHGEINMLLGTGQTRNLTFEANPSEGGAYVGPSSFQRSTRNCFTFHR